MQRQHNDQSDDHEDRHGHPVHEPHVGPEQALDGLVEASKRAFAPVSGGRCALHVASSFALPE
jgi:hypothetical protein